MEGWKDTNIKCPGCGSLLKLQEKCSGEVFRFNDIEMTGEADDSTILKCSDCHTDISMTETIFKQANKEN